MVEECGALKKDPAPLVDLGEEIAGRVVRHAARKVKERIRKKG